MANKVDFRLLLPDWMFESERFVEFVEVLEDFTDEIISNIDNIALLENLLSLLESGEWVEEFVRQLGAGFGFDENELNKIAGDIGELVRRVGTYDAFRYLVEQVYGGVVLENNFDKVLRLSESRTLSGAYLQDGRFYRDGSWGVWLPYFLLTDRNLRIMKQWFPVGVFLFFFALMFLFLFQSNDKIDFEVGYCLPVFSVNKGYHFMTEVGIKDYYGEGQQYLNENWQYYRMVVNEDVIVLS